MYPSLDAARLGPVANGKPGRPRKGAASFHVSTVKDAARELVRQYITDKLGPMLQAQIAHATGIGHCYTRDKHGKFSRVESADRIDALLREGTEGEHYFIFAKDPSAVAFKELLDRALDRPKDQSKEIHVSGEVELSTRLTSARRRVFDVPPAPRLPPAA